MITYSIIQKSKLEGALRLDAEYYQPEYLEVAQKLSKAKNIADLTSDIRYGLYVEPEYKEVGVDFVRAMNLLNFWIDGKILKIDESKVPPAYRLKTGDSLIVRSGANTGSVGLVYPKFQNATFGSYTIRLRFNRVNPFFAATFLNSKYGTLQTKRFQTGMAQPNLNIPNIKEIKIPTISDDDQEKIEKLCLEIEKLKEQSESLYSQAEDLLLEELELKDFEIEDILSYIVNFSEIKFAHRADAEYFQPKYKKIINSLGKDKKILKTIAKRKTKRSKLIKENNYRYIEISDINISNGEASFNVIQGSDLPVNAKIKIDGGELIISKVRPMRGAVAVIPDDWSGNFIASGAFSIFEVGSPLREYVQVVLRSIIGKLQLEKPTTGTSYPTVTDEDVENLFIPILPKPTQQKIADLVQKSHEAHSKAKQLLEQTKSEVENLIEK